MNFDDLDIDWGYLLERLEGLMDLAEEALARQIMADQVQAEIAREAVALRWQRQGQSGFLREITSPDIPDPGDLLGMERTLARLQQNTRQFARGYSANNVLLWGEPGTGKSSAIKSLLKTFAPEGLRMIEVQKKDLFQLPMICAQLRALPQRFILYCDDLCFGESRFAYPELKALLEGSLEARPANVLVYATSNGRHLMPERKSENIEESEIHPEEAVPEKLSFPDLFGIAVGFSPMDQQTYLAIVRHMAARLKLPVAEDQLVAEALQWAQLRGTRSGRVASQFIADLGGRLACAEHQEARN